MENPEPGPAFFAQQLRKPSGEFADEIAKTMDQVNAPLFDLTFETMQLKNGQSVLEIGFGSGKFFGKLFQQAERLTVCGLDYSEEMVESAKRYNQSAVNSNSLTLEFGSSDAIPFPDHTFDKVFCNMVVYFWDEPAKHLKEVSRVLKPGGQFYTGIRSKDSMMKLPFIDFGFNVYTQSDWKSILNKNGFEVIGVEESLDTEMEIANQQMQMESICIVAKRR